MSHPNRNKTKKICIDFGLIPKKIIDHELFRPSQIQVGARPVPHIFGNCTWISHPYFSNVTIAQIVFASADEKKLMRVVEKYNGKIIPIRTDLNQWQIEEIDNTNNAKTHKVELNNETIEGRYNALEGQYNGNTSS